MLGGNTSLPKVSVICLCYNHASFIQNCIESVLEQTYPNVEIILVNDASTDDSAIIIQSLIETNPQILFLNLTKNVGNCRAFNQGLKKATGEYIIDLSCDDVLMTDRIEKQVKAFEKLSEDFGVMFSDATYINEAGNELGDHFSNYLPVKGDIYEDLVRRYFIAPPTMMIRKAVFDELRGYDETLAYEDFDFWIRSARNWKYDYLNESLTCIRKTSGSLSSMFYEQDNLLTASTLEVCKKIKALNKSEQEDVALAQRIRYELKMACLTGSKAVSTEFFELLSTIETPGLASRFWLFFSWLGWNAMPLVRSLKHS